jgi:hypothetical protein
MESYDAAGKQNTSFLKGVATPVDQLEEEKKEEKPEEGQNMEEEKKNALKKVEMVLAWEAKGAWDTNVTKEGQIKPVNVQSMSEGCHLMVNAT